MEPRGYSKLYHFIICVSVVLILCVFCASPVLAADLYLDIDFKENLFMDKYNVELAFDDDKIDVLTHGKYYTKMLHDVTEGQHSLTFSKEGNSKVISKIDIEVTSSTSFKATVTTHGKSIDIKDVMLSEDLSKSAIEVPSVEYLLLSEASDVLKESGLGNVNWVSADGDSINVLKNWVVTSQNIQAGKTCDQNDEIVLECKLAEQFFKEWFLGRSYQDALSNAEKIHYKPSTIHELTGDPMGERINECPSEDIPYWIVNNVEYQGNRELTLNMIFTGSRAVPVVKGKTLAEAEEILTSMDFSDVRRAPVGEQSIGKAENWIVVDQVLENEQEIYVDQPVILTVEHKDDIAADEAAEKEKNRAPIEQDRIKNNSITEGSSEVVTEKTKEKQESQTESEQKLLETQGNEEKVTEVHNQEKSAPSTETEKITETEKHVEVVLEKETELPKLSDTKLYVTKSNLNIRKSPDSNGEKLGTLKAGEEIHVLSTEDGWAKILTGGAIAYVALPYIEEKNQAERDVVLQTEAPQDETTAPVRDIPQEEMVWIPNSGSKYHSRSGCSNMRNPREVTLSQAINMGYEPCKKCH